MQVSHQGFLGYQQSLRAAVIAELSLLGLFRGRMRRFHVPRSSSSSSQCDAWDRLSLQRSHLSISPFLGVVV